MREKLLEVHPLFPIAPHIPLASVQSSDVPVGVRQFFVELVTRVNHVGRESVMRAFEIAPVVALL